MEKQKMIFGLVAALVFFSLVIGGCTQQNSPTNQTNPPPTGTTLQQILAKADTYESVYYEVEISTTMSGSIVQNTTIKVWQKTPYLKEEITSTVGNETTQETVIQRPEGVYRYNIGQHIYENNSGIVIPQVSTGDTAKDLLDNHTITTVGTETVDGKTATVIEYPRSQADNTTIMKMWIWNEKGLPLKVYFAMSINDTNMTMNYHYNNYSFSDIPDSTFSVS
jgi:outer membrane lipoprotein-sorting protein